MDVHSIQLRVSLTGRYATALYREAATSKNITTILQDMEIFKNLLNDHNNLRQILERQFLRSESSMTIIDEIGKLMGFSKLFIDFLKILVINHRFNFWQNIFRDFVAIVDKQTNTVPVYVETVSTSKAHLQAIEGLINRMHPNRSHRFAHQHVPELLGGFRVLIQDRCLDYSLKSRLNRLSYQLKEA